MMTLEVIDGQQRLTSLPFYKSILNEEEQKEIQPKDKQLDEIQSRWNIWFKHFEQS